LLEKKEWEIGLLCAPGEERCVKKITKGISVKIEKPEFSKLLTTVQSYDAMVATDSGPINLAILSGIPVVDIMGPGDSSMWGPTPGRGILLQNVKNYSCHPCLQKRCVCPLNPCIGQVSLEDVKDGLEEIRAQVEEGRTDSILNKKLGMQSSG
jgi:ADP-heptose:LPS heptosyltransferase